MKNYLRDACEEIDAAIFSGDALYTSFEELKEYVYTWDRTLKQHEAILKLGEKEEERVLHRTIKI